MNYMNVYVFFLMLRNLLSFSSLCPLSKAKVQAISIGVKRCARMDQNHYQNQYTYKINNNTDESK